MVTIKKIAQMAGVSRGTVDRVLNNRGAVNEQTAERVWEIARSLQYTPNKAARSLSVLKHGAKLCYILFAPQSNPFFAQVEQGLRKKAAELSEYGVTLTIEYGDFNNAAHQDELIDRLVDQGVEGIALCGFNSDSTAQKIRALADAGIPVVTANTDIPNSGRLAYVGSHYESAGRTAARLMHLITNGKVRIGVILGSSHILCHSKRVEGFSSYLAQNAPDLTISVTAENDDDDFKSFSITKDMLEQHADIDALYLVSAGVYGACRAVEMLPVEKRPKIICHDCPDSTKEMLLKGLISATICQQPDYQGAKPLDLLFQRLCLDEMPSREFYFTKNEIIVSENL